MNRTLCFFIAFILLIPNTFGRYTEQELREIWRKTGFRLEFVLLHMREYCHTSEKQFVACMTNLHWLLSNVDQDNPRELRISDSNTLDVVPYSKETKTYDELVALENERRESFLRFFHSQQSKNDSPRTFASIEGFDSLLNFAATLIRNHIPTENEPYFMGRFFNHLVKKSIDPYASLQPSVMLRNSPKNYEGIGVNATKYKTDNERLNGGIAVNPFKGSPARSAGLKRGDIILAIDGLSVKEESIEASIDRMRGPRETKMELTINSFCDNDNDNDNDNNEKIISVIREPVSYSSNIIKDSRFVSLRQQESMGCQPSSSSKGPQALYVPLKSFMPSKIKGGELHLCKEFVELQKMDLGNADSRGMIVDLRGNRGGNLFGILCVLNTIIPGTDLLLKGIPIKSGELSGEAETFYHFTNAGLIDLNNPFGRPINPNHPSPIPVSYNRNIIVLVDRGSTSASEVFAGTLQDKKRGWVIGDRTFGKASMQTFEPVVIIPGIQTQDTTLNMVTTVGVYTLNSGRFIQDHGITPDFWFSNTGEPIENSHISRGQNLLNNIGIENSPWRQNRPDELEYLKDCANNNGTLDMLGSAFRKKAQSEEKYNRPFVANYPLELAKDILMCSPPVQDYLVHSELYDPSKTPFSIIKNGEEKPFNSQ